MRKINTRNFVRATRSTPRAVNRQILLNLVREHEPISRADLARRMEVARGMVTSLVDELVTDGSLYEGATIDSPRGRRPQMLFVRTRGRLALCVDVRFSRTYVMLGDFSGMAIATESFETIEDTKAFVAEVRKRTRRLLTAHGAAGTCEGLGLVVPGMVDSVTGRVLNAPHLGWRNVDVRDALSVAVGLPVFVENAPIACALAQMWLGQRGAMELSDFVYVSVSDGVGTGVVIDGQVMRGKRNTSGEFGHVPLSADGPDCHCGGRGCLEAYASDLATLVRYLGREFSPATARAIVQASGLTMTDVVTRYYVRMQVEDRPKVLAAVAGVFGDFEVSIASVVQREAHEGIADIVWLTHPAIEKNIDDAMTKIRTLDAVRAIHNRIRVED